MIQTATIGRLFLTVVLALPLPSPSHATWDNPPEKWSLSDTYKILRESPWSPANVTLEASYTQRHTDPLTGIVSGSPVNANNTGLVRGVEVSRSKPLPAVSVLWWSSKTIRLAQQRLAQLRASSAAGVPALRAEDLPDYVLAIEGEEPQRIFRDAREDLHDTVFLELDNGLTLDLTGVRFVEATDTSDPRTEFHFPRHRDGRPTIDANVERVVFHCRATAKAPREGRGNAIAVRVEFSPKAMRVRNVPDL